MDIVHIGIDLAKNVFVLHGVSDTGAVQLRQPKVSRSKLGEVVAALPPCTIGIEACTGAHHRARQGYVQARTATINRFHGLLAEFGIVLPQKAEVVRRQPAQHLEDLPGYANLVIGDLFSQVHPLDERIKQYDAHVRAMAKQCTAAQQLMQLCGVGETTATAIVAMVDNAREFDSGRQFEPPRILRRLQLLRRWSHEQVEQVFT